MCCNRDKYYGSGFILLFIFKIIIGSFIIILTHSPIGYIIGSILILMAFGVFIKIILMNRDNNENNIEIDIEKDLMNYRKYKISNKERLNEYLIKSLIEYIYNNDNNIDIINEKINNIISNDNDDRNDNDYKNDNDRKDLLIKIQRELIQMKVKELNNIMINNLKDVNNISEKTIQDNLNTNKRNLEAYKDDLRVLFNSLNEIKIDINIKE
jgi:hypothetical protein